MEKVELLYLSQEEVIQLGLGMAEVIDIIEQVLAEHGKKAVELPPKPGVHPIKNTFIHAMPAFIPAMDACGIKWVSGYPDNYKHGLPQILGLLVLNDVNTGVPTAIMDCRWITAVRTAAVTAVTAKYCARKDSETVGLIGAGVQGRFHILALKEVLPNLKQVKVYDIREEAADDYVAVMSEKTGLEIVKVTSPQAAVVDSDIVITASQSLPKPIIEFEWLKEGVFGVGLESGKAWGASIQLMDKFVTDDWDQTQYFAKIGAFPGGLPASYHEIGEIVLGKRAGRENSREKIIACNVGMATEDVAVGTKLLELAINKKVGTTLSLMEKQTALI
ncbi:MAG: ornithine cyclodeaminase family protein [Clostridia bacterium]